VNPRLSRSSALASKATGYPLAFVAAKLGLGIELPQIQNSVTKNTTACFEPSLDYCVVKYPRWDLRKFDRVSHYLGSSMKSIGEVMAIGRNFEEAIQKSIRMVDSTNPGFEAGVHSFPDVAGRAIENGIDHELKNPTDRRMFAIAEAFKRGDTPDEIHEVTRIDKWYLYKLFNIWNASGELGETVSSIPALGEEANKDVLMMAKKHGLSDRQIAGVVLGKGGNDATTAEELEVRAHRKGHGIVPIVKQIDTLAAEFPALTNYLYTTYSGEVDDVVFDEHGTVVLGSGVYRIGSSVEFDFCSVECIRELRNLGKKTVMINYNPETVSTDFDESDRLYFDELSLERVLDIYEKEAASGLVVSVGGQSPNNIALDLHKNGVNVLGTHPENIDGCEDRDKYSAMLDNIGVKQPAWRTLTDLPDAHAFCEETGYPVLIRPSYVLSGAAMHVAHSAGELDAYLADAVSVSSDHPVVITKFLDGAKEIDVDGVAQKGELKAYAISEHVEKGGTHSGDATLLLPAQTLSKDVMDKIVKDSAKIAEALNISGTSFFPLFRYYRCYVTRLVTTRTLPPLSLSLAVCVCVCVLLSSSAHPLSLSPLSLFFSSHHPLPLHSFRPVQHAVSRERRLDRCDRNEPARIAVCSVRLEGLRRPVRPPRNTHYGAAGRRSPVRRSLLGAD